MPAASRSSRRGGARSPTRGRCSRSPSAASWSSGTAGTISSYDYEPSIRVQTQEHPEGTVVPVDTLQPPYQNPVQYMIHCIATGEPVRGPLSPAMCRVGQQIVDSALLSAREKRTVPLVS